MIAEATLLMEKFNILEKHLSDFLLLSGRLSSSDLELVDETQVIFDERERIIREIKSLRPQITDIIDSQTPEKASMIRKMLVGETVMVDFTEDEKMLQGKIISIRSIQSDIMKSEAGNKMRFRVKYGEVRTELEDLQREKKKITFYQNARVDEKGAEFDNQM
ncbi:MAG: hypothetical protein FWG70_04815 [Oscillospiraceae bacterium]|nr:hypothetical protein [Oscillospiraceae bacterium]